jgi:hypothetical protein
MTLLVPQVSVRNEVGVVCDPLAPSTVGRGRTSRSVAPRPESLDGKVLAVIDNGMGKQAPGLGFGEVLVQKLRQLVDLADVIYIRKDAVNVPPRPEDWDEVCRRGDVGLALYGA